MQQTFTHELDQTLDLTDQMNFCRGEIGRKCPKCSGEGTDHNDESCWECNGYGVIVKGEE